MATTDEVVDPLNDLRVELSNAIISQASRINHQDVALSNVIDWIGELTTMMKEVHLSLQSPRAPDSSNHHATKSIRLDLPKFQGVDRDGWLFQAEEYFQFHGIADDSKIQIAGFHMIKGALAWIRGLRRNKLLSTWKKFEEDLREQFSGSTFEEKLQE